MGISTTLYSEQTDVGLNKFVPFLFLWTSGLKSAELPRDWTHNLQTSQHHFTILSWWISLKWITFFEHFTSFDHKIIVWKPRGFGLRTLTVEATSSDTRPSFLTGSDSRLEPTTSELHRTSSAHWAVESAACRFCVDYLVSGSSVRRLLLDFKTGL